MSHLSYSCFTVAILTLLLHHPRSLAMLTNAMIRCILACNAFLRSRAGGERNAWGNLLPISLTFSRIHLSSGLLIGVEVQWAWGEITRISCISVKLGRTLHEPADQTSTPAPRQVAQAGASPELAACTAEEGRDSPESRHRWYSGEEGSDGPEWIVTCCMRALVFKREFSRIEMFSTSTNERASWGSSRWHGPERQDFWGCVLLGYRDEEQALVTSQLVSCEEGSHSRWISIDRLTIMGVIYLGPNEGAATHATIQESELSTTPGISRLQHLEWGRWASAMACEAERITVAIVMSSYRPPRITMLLCSCPGSMWMGLVFTPWLREGTTEVVPGSSSLARVNPRPALCTANCRREPPALSVDGFLQAAAAVIASRRSAPRPVDVSLPNVGCSLDTRLATAFTEPQVTSFALRHPLPTSIPIGTAGFATFFVSGTAIGTPKVFTGKVVGLPRSFSTRCYERRATSRQPRQPRQAPAKVLRAGEGEGVSEGANVTIAARRGVIPRGSRRRTQYGRIRSPGGFVDGAHAVPATSGRWLSVVGNSAHGRELSISSGILASLARRLPAQVGGQAGGRRSEVPPSTAALITAPEAPSSARSANRFARRDPPPREEAVPRPVHQENSPRHPRPEPLVGAERTGDSDPESHHAEIAVAHPSVGSIASNNAPASVSDRSSTQGSPHGGAFAEHELSRYLEHFKVGKNNARIRFPGQSRTHKFKESKVKLSPSHNEKPGIGSGGRQMGKFKVGGFLRGISPKATTGTSIYDRVKGMFGRQNKYRAEVMQVPPPSTPVLSTRPVSPVSPTSPVSPLSPMSLAENMSIPGQVSVSPSGRGGPALERGRFWFSMRKWWRPSRARDEGRDLSGSGAASISPESPSAARFLMLPSPILPKNHEGDGQTRSTWRDSVAGSD